MIELKTCRKFSGSGNLPGTTSRFKECDPWRGAGFIIEEQNMTNKNSKAIMIIIAILALAALGAMIFAGCTIDSDPIRQWETLCHKQGVR